VANLKVNARVTAPETIDIPLVRADVMHVSQTFRVFFEVFLALTSTLSGYIFALVAPSHFHWAVLVICVLTTAAFLVLSMRKQREAKLAA
jgi:hypothetical protein